MDIFSPSIDHTLILNGLYLGNFVSSQDSKFISESKIGAIVNCTPSVPNKFCNEIEYMRLNLNDTSNEDDKMLKYINPAVEFIYKNLNIDGKNVFVHCHAGVSRSPTIVVAYLMKYYSMTLDDAIRFVQKRRPKVFYNGKQYNFKNALSIYQDRLTELKK
jgi:protein-tyrosine phosphatase